MLNSPRETKKVYGIDGDKVGGLIDALFINPRRKTPGFSHGDRRRVPFGA